MLKDREKKVLKKQGQIFFFYTFPSKKCLENYSYTRPINYIIKYAITVLNSENLLKVNSTTLLISLPASSKILS